MIVETDIVALNANTFLGKQHAMIYL